MPGWLVIESCSVSAQKNAQVGGIVGYCLYSAYIKLRKTVSTVFHTLFSAMMDVGGVYHTDDRELTESHKMETEDSLSRNGELFPGDPPYNLRSKEEKSNLEHDVFTQQYIRDHVKNCLEFNTLGTKDAILVFSYNLIDVIRRF